MVRYAKKTIDGLWTRGDTLIVSPSRKNRHGFPLQVEARIDTWGRRTEIRSSVHPDDVQASPIYSPDEPVQS